MTAKEQEERDIMYADLDKTIAEFAEQERRYKQRQERRKSKSLDHNKPGL